MWQEDSLRGQKQIWISKDRSNGYFHVHAISRINPWCRMMPSLTIYALTNHLVWVTTSAVYLFFFKKGYRQILWGINMLSTGSKQSSISIARCRNPAKDLNVNIMYIKHSRGNKMWSLMMMIPSFTSVRLQCSGPFNASVDKASPFELTCCTSNSTSPKETQGFYLVPCHAKCSFNSQ